MRCVQWGSEGVASRKDKDDPRGGGVTETTVRGRVQDDSGSEEVKDDSGSEEVKDDSQSGGDNGSGEVKDPGSWGVKDDSWWGGVKESSWDSWVKMVTRVPEIAQMNIVEGEYASAFPYTLVNISQSWGLA